MVAASPNRGILFPHHKIEPLRQHTIPIQFDAALGWFCILHRSFAREIGSSSNRVAGGTRVEYTIRVPFDDHHTLRFGMLHTVNDIEGLIGFEDSIAF